MFASPTFDSKLKGDEGIYAAIDAAALARALRGATLSRLVLLSSTPGNAGKVVLGAQSTMGCRMAAVEDLHRATLREITADSDVSQYSVQVPVGIPADTTSDELKRILPHIRRILPGAAMSYEDVVRLQQILNLNGTNVTTLDLTSAVPPTETREPSLAVMQEKMAELRERFPLSPQKGRTDSREDSDEEEEEEREARYHNAELRARCEELHIPYTEYTKALRDVAHFEMNPFRLICRLLARDRRLKVVLLDHNQLGAESTTSEGAVELAPLRALARAIDGNECLKVLGLSHNSLGPNGVGVIAKALTKNISLVEVDLSSNNLNAPAFEEIEDPEHEEEDPVFGETYSGLEAISELLKKNKFLRVLKLRHNGIHAGDDLSGDVPDDDELGLDPANDAHDITVSEQWEDTPLWRMVSPLMRFHRLKVLDLTGNQLKSQGTRILATALAANTSLEVLDLTDNAIGFRGLHYLATLVISSPKSVLHTLVVRRNELSGKRTSKMQQRMALTAMEAFAQSLQGNRTVRRLFFSGNHLGATLSAALLGTVAEAESLEELDFENNEACGEHAGAFDPAVAHILATALHSQALAHRPVLATLHLAGNNLRSAGLGILLGSDMTSHCPLRELGLARNDIGNDLEPVNRLLVSSSTIASIDLSHNSITSAQQLLQGLGTNRSLTTLNLSHNLLGSQDPRGGVQGAHVDEVRQLVSALASHSMLTALDLSYNDLRDTDAETIMSSFSQSNAAPQLRKLDVSDNPNISSVQVTAMVQYLALRPGLQVFNASLPAGVTNQEPIMRAVEAAVQSSTTLLDINCGLRGSGSAATDESLGSAEGERIAAMRQRLLLNALLSQ